MVLIPIVIIALVWAAFSTYAALVRRRASRRWYATFFSLMFAGACVGVYFGFFFDYYASPTVRVYSFPVPAVFLVLESYENGTQQWIDFVTPAPMLFAGSNIPIFACTAVLPLRLICLFVPETNA